MRHYHLTRQAHYQPVINLNQLWSLVTKETREKYANDKSKAVVIDCVKNVSDIHPHEE